MKVKMKVELIIRFGEDLIPRYVFVVEGSNKVYIAQREVVGGWSGSLNGELYDSIWSAISEAVKRIVESKPKKVTVLAYDQECVPYIIDVFEMHGVKCSVITLVRLGKGVRPFQTKYA